MVIESRLLERDAGGKPVSAFPHPALGPRLDATPIRGPASAPRLLPPPLHGGRDSEAFAIFGDRAPGYVDIDGFQPCDDRIVGKYLPGAFPFDQLLDPESHRFRRMGIAAIARRDRGGKEIFEFEEAARRRHIFVGGDTRYGGFMHAHRLRDRLKIERPQIFDAMREETVLLADDLAGYLQNRACPLFETLRQPVRGLPASRNEAPVGLLSLVLSFSLPIADSCHIAVIDQNPRKNIGVKLDMPRAVRQRPHDDIGEDRLDRTAADGTPGPGIEPPDLAQHVENILFLDIANLT